MKRVFSVLLVLLLSLFSIYRFFEEWKLVSGFPVTAWLEDHSADCAVVLTGGSGRVREGFDLLEQRQVRKLIVSGVHPSSGFHEIFPQWPFYPEVKESDVILDRRSGTTFGNAQQTLPLVEALNCRGIILVTSQIHMHRASMTFAGIYPPDYPITLRSTFAGGARPDLLDLGLETFKSLFYTLWVY